MLHETISEPIKARLVALRAAGNESDRLAAELSTQLMAERGNGERIRAEISRLEKIINEEPPMISAPPARLPR